MDSDEYVIDIACGPLHTIVVSNKNRLYSCGYGGSFALGHGNRQTQSRFKKIHYFVDVISEEETILKIGAGVSHSGCLTNERLYIWGT